VRSVSVGNDFYSLLLDVAGDIWAWGHNSQGQ
jgi:alpha-tubulin suppressor-like RCC1 family protein